MTPLQLGAVPYWAPFVGSSTMVGMAIWSGLVASVVLVFCVCVAEALPVLLLLAFPASIESENVKLFLLGLNAALLLLFVFLVEFELVVALAAGYWLPMLAYFILVTLLPSISNVIQGLFVGNTAAAHNESLLRRHKITHVLELLDGRNSSVAKKTSSSSSSSNAVDANKANSVVRLALPYRPADDVGDVLEDAVRFIDAAHKAKGNVLIACHTGISRSPIVAAGYLVRGHGYNCKEAVRIVTEKRSVADPSLRLQMRLRELHPLHNYSS